MPLLGQAAVAMWWNIAPELKDEFEDWHSHEHFPERMGIAGFNRGSRWAEAGGAVGAGTGYFVLYELERHETLTSTAYRERLDNPTPWSTQMMPHHQGMVRSQCRVLASFGGGVGRALATVRFAAAPGEEGRLLAWLEKDALAGLAARPGITGAHLLQTQTPQGVPMTTEQKIRGGDAAADLILVLAGYSASAVEGCAHEELADAKFASQGARPGMRRDLFTLSYCLSAGDRP